MIKKILIFLVINFAALGIGGFFTGPGVSSDWYTNLNQAPWTPPGWFFGAAWTTIMICFSFFMAFLYEKSYFKKEIIVLLYSTMDFKHNMESNIFSLPKCIAGINSYKQFNSNCIHFFNSIPRIIESENFVDFTLCCLACNRNFAKHLHSFK